MDHGANKNVTDRWDWDRLSRNEGLPWSIELIERYESRWNWFTSSRLRYPIQALTTLMPADITAVMAHHFS